MTLSNFNITVMNNPVEIYEKLLSKFLSATETITDDIKREIARKAILTVNPPLYATIIYMNTRDLETTVKGHKAILDEACRIICLDIYFETRKEEYKSRAEKYLTDLIEKINPEQTRELINLEDKLFMFWNYEQELSVKMKNGEDISSAEIERHTLRKSEDIYLYSMIAGFFAPVPKEVVQEFYRRQLIRDFYDDMGDLLEDFEQTMPNPLLLRLSQKITLDFCDQHSLGKLKQLVKTNKVDQGHKKFIDNYLKGQPINLPREYKWLRNYTQI